ncbi:MAG: YceD family protein [Desulfonatronovibrionaceae bacterium]
MNHKWLALADIPVQGREFYFDGTQDRELLAREMDQNLRLEDDFQARISILPQKQGLVVHGSLQGGLVSRCFRCLEPARVQLKQEFDLFEEFPAPAPDTEKSFFLKFENNQWLVNIFQILREQIILAVPDKILCFAECLGICPECGANRNTSPCSCSQKSNDPRLAVLRQMKINK